MWYFAFLLLSDLLRKCLSTREFWDLGTFLLPNRCFPALQLVRRLSSSWCYLRRAPPRPLLLGATALRWCGGASEAFVSPWAEVKLWVTRLPRSSCGPSPRALSCQDSHAFHLFSSGLEGRAHWMEPGFCVSWLGSVQLKAYQSLEINSL